VDDSGRYTGNIVILKLKKQQGDVLEQDIELCPSCHFPVTIAGKEEGSFLCKFLGFHTFIVCCFSFVLIHKN
jgi:hypothetical protein